MEIDWGDGDYARTARALAPAAEVLLDSASVTAGHSVLDVGCGTGNVALAAAARGAAATGVDPSARLVALARERAARAGADARFLTGEAGRLPLPDGDFDATLSAFAVIFAPDPAQALAEMVRVTRPGGAVALTSWRSEGPIFAAGRILREAFPSGDGAGPEPRWHDAAWVAEALGAAGARDVRTTTAGLGYSAESPEAWLAEHEEHHPAWRWGRRTLGPGTWRGVRAQMLAALHAGNEDRSAFRTRSHYLVAVAAR